MSAGRNASMLFVSAVMTLVLFLVFAGVSRLDALEKHAYVPGVGWQQPADNAPGIHGVCAPDSATGGFPLADSRQAALPDNCSKAHNVTARAIDFALYFAVAAIIGVGAANIVRQNP
jgi:hypothetical protein